MWKAHMLASLAMLLSAPSTDAASGCGSRGGPGYRGPNGKCVGWEQLARVCGSPPTERCAPEGSTNESRSSARRQATELKFDKRLPLRYSGGICAKRTLGHC